MSKLESAFLLFFEDVRADHELLGGCLDVQQLLATDARSLGQRCVAVNVVGVVAAVGVLFVVERINRLTNEVTVDVTDVHAVLVGCLPNTLAHVNASSKFALDVLDGSYDLVLATTPSISAHSLCDRMSVSYLLLFLDLMFVQSLLFDHMWLFWLNLFLLFDLKSRNRVLLYSCARSHRQIQGSYFFILFVIFILSLTILR